MQPDTSVIIPSYNNAQYLGRCLESVLSKTRVEIETIVVDDGSTDDSERVFGDYESRVTILRQANRGACNARNAGLKIARGEMVKFLDADDYLAEGALARQRDQLLATGRRDVSVYGDVAWVDPAENIISRSENLGGDELRSGKGSLGMPLTSAPLHWTENVRKVGGFDPRLPRAQEFDLHIRMWFAGIDFVYQPGLTYYYQQHDGPRISSRDRMAETYEARLAAYRRYLLAADEISDPQVAENLRIELSRAIWSLGRLAIRGGIPGSVVKECFSLAKTIGGRKALTGSKAYKFTNRLLCPLRTEKVMSAFKKVIRWTTNGRYS